MPGSVLSALELLEFVPLLAVTRVLKKSLETDGDSPPVAELASVLTPFPHLERALEDALGPEGEVRDGASPELRRIRRERETCRERLRTRLERLTARIPSGETAALVTLREGRYVLSLPLEHRAKVPGIVLDRSGSGATLYLEPLDAVDENNALREFDSLEAAEIQRVLAALTDRARQGGDALVGNWERAGEIDSLRARVLLAARWQGERPVFAEGPALELRGARHPFLLEGRGAGQDRNAARRAVIPLDLRLDVSVRILLITGPNMGGKTVALKTVGLLSVMAQSGCFIPAGAGSMLPWVRNWAVSLGDEQSLEQDLSTFGAHLRRWAEALALAGPGTLVLLDELGSGTDPTEGAALAQSVLEGLLDAGAMGLVTTHLGTLKGFAASTGGIRNASMIFDAATRSPAYTLAVGVPGESHALEMARHLGFPGERVARAEALLPREERDMRRLLADLREERARIGARERELAERIAAGERVEAERRQGLLRFLEDRAELRSRAARQAREIVRRAEELLRSAERDAAEGRRSAELGRKALAREHERLSRLETEPRPRVKGTAPEEIRAGDHLWALSLGREVEVVREPDSSGRVVVEAEGVRVTLPRETLQIPGGEGMPSAGTGSARAALRERTAIPEAVDAAVEIDLRGLRVEESLSRLESALDQAMLAGLKRLRVIHGKGTGALREAVQEYCRTHDAVSDAQIAEQWEGGTGVTVITLKD